MANMKNLAANVASDMKQVEASGAAEFGYVHLSCGSIVNITPFGKGVVRVSLHKANTCEEVAFKDFNAQFVTSAAIVAWLKSIKSEED